MRPHLSFPSSFFIILLIVASLSSCKKDSKSIPEIHTVTVSEITRSTAVSGGNVLNDGGDKIVTRGICWSTQANPTLECERTIQTGNTGWFTSTITSLSANTRYFVRAYAINDAGTGYGNELTFTTSPLSVATLTTSYEVMYAGIAQLEGVVTDDGGSPVTDRGFCWAVSMPHPVINGLHTHNGSGSGTFTDNLTDVQDSIHYYIRAFATNAIGTAYGNELDLYLTVGCKR